MTALGKMNFFLNNRWVSLTRYVSISFLKLFQWHLARENLIQWHCYFVENCCKFILSTENWRRNYSAKNCRATQKSWQEKNRKSYSFHLSKMLKIQNTILKICCKNTQYPIILVEVLSEPLVCACTLYQEITYHVNLKNFEIFSKLLII